MKFLLCHNYYHYPGGESEVFENEAKGLTQMGENVLIYSRANVDIGEMSVLQKMGAGLSAYSSGRTMEDILDLVKKETPDVAIVQNVFPLITPSIYVALAQAGIPIVQAVYNYRFVCPSAELYTEGKICERCVPGNTVHAVIHRCYRDNYYESAWYASIIGLHRLLGTFSKLIDSFMVPDHFLGTKLVHGGIPLSKIWRNPNPVFLKDVQPVTTHQGFVLFAGRLVAQKGILTLLKAMEQSKPSTRLVIVGLGDLGDTVRERIRLANLSSRVVLMGPVWGDDLDNLIRHCAAIVIPSEWYDNLPMILCRAYALGKPVIASRINGIPEYVTHGETGYLFEPGNASELARWIDEILGLSMTKYQQISSLARTFAEDVLDYSNHYRSLMHHILTLKENKKRSV